MAYLVLIKCIADSWDDFLGDSMNAILLTLKNLWKQFIGAGAYKVPDELAFLVNRNKIQNTTNEMLTKKVCVITGATSGVGFETAKELVAHNASLILVARNKYKAESIRNTLLSSNSVPIDIIIADFSKLDEVHKAATEILAKYKKIDILINCAGLYSTKKIYTEDGFELVFCVNHLASLLFTLLLENRLIESAPARIIQVNSEGHRFNGLKEQDLNWKKRLYTGLRGYGASKTAQLMCAWELSEKLAPKGVTINAVHPGEVKTDIGMNNGWLYRFFSKHITSKFLKDPKIAGKALYYLAASPDVRETSGKYFNLSHEEIPAKHATNRVMGKRIFEESLKMISSYM